jgi:1-acyl-sn-glycerol-3-phosphate acyltransferase
MFDIFLNISNKVNKILLSSYRNVIEPCYIMHLDIMRYLWATFIFNNFYSLLRLLSFTNEHSINEPFYKKLFYKWISVHMSFREGVNVFALLFIWTCLQMLPSLPIPSSTSTFAQVLMEKTYATWVAYCCDILKMYIRPTVKRTNALICMNHLISFVIYVLLYMLLCRVTAVAHWSSKLDLLHGHRSALPALETVCNTC